MNTRTLSLVVALVLFSPFALAAGDIGFLELQFPQIGIVDPSRQVINVQLAPMDASYVALGRIVYQDWYDPENDHRQHITARVTVAVPNKLPDFEAIDDAMDVMSASG